MINISTATDLQPLDIPSATTDNNDKTRVYAAYIKSLPLNPTQIIQKLKTQNAANHKAVSFINPERVFTLFQLKVAILKALRVSPTMRKSKSTQTEVLYNLSSSGSAAASNGKNVVDCIRWFGLRDNSTSAIVMALCNTSMEFTEAIQQFFDLQQDCDQLELESLEEYFNNNNNNKERSIDWDFIRKHYNLSFLSAAEESTPLIIIERFILSSMAVNNL